MSTRTLLHIDDNKDDLFLFKKACLVNAAPFNLPEVASAKDALRYLQGIDIYADRSKFPIPDVVLLDLKMPPPDGFGILRWIRERPGFNHIAVCILTSSFQREDIQKAYALGANCFLTKSANFENLLVLVAALSQALSKRPPQFDALQQLPEFRQ